jgi:ankyrin repeat protein
MECNPFCGLFWSFTYPQILYGKVFILLRIFNLYSLGDINAESNDGWTPFQLAIYKNHKNIIKYLLSHPDLEINKLTKKGTPLHIACYYNREEVVRLLLSKKADPK